MPRPLDILRFCPTHDVYMVPQKFEWWDINQGAVDGFRCPNLSCQLVYIDGHMDGFYTLEPNGDLTPYRKSSTQPQ
jgi:hypothetical protein